MATKVLGSWALMAFFEDEPAAEQEEKVLAQAAADRLKLLLSVVNWGEIDYNHVSREAANQEAARRALANINRITWKLGVRIRGSRRSSHQAWMGAEEVASKHSVGHTISGMPSSFR